MVVGTEEFVLENRMEFHRTPLNSTTFSVVTSQESYGQVKIGNSPLKNCHTALKYLDFNAFDSCILAKPKSTENCVEYSLIPFPQKLYMILSPINSDVIDWLPDGRAFRCKNLDRFINEILPRYFKHNRITSFQRQLNLYGFKRLNRRYVEYGGYSHPYFCKGREDLLPSIKRVKKSVSLNQLIGDNCQEDREFQQNDDIISSKKEEKPVDSAVTTTVATISSPDDDGDESSSLLTNLRGHDDMMSMPSIYQSSDSPNTHPLSTSIGSSSIFPPVIRRGLSISKVSLNSTPVTTKQSSSLGIQEINQVPDTLTENHFDLYHMDYFDMINVTHTHPSDSDLSEFSLSNHLSTNSSDSYNNSTTTTTTTTATATNNEECIDFDNLFETATNSVDDTFLFSFDTCESTSAYSSPTQISAGYNSADIKSVSSTPSDMDIASLSIPPSLADVITGTISTHDNHHNRAIHISATDTLSNLTTHIPSTLLHQLEDQLVSTIKSWVNTSLLPCLNTYPKDGRGCDDTLTEVTAQYVHNIKDHVNNMLLSMFSISKDANVRSECASLLPPQSIYIHSDVNEHRENSSLGGDTPMMGNNWSTNAIHDSKLTLETTQSNTPATSPCSTPKSDMSPLLQSSHTPASQLLNSTSFSHMCNPSANTNDRQDARKLHVHDVTVSDPEILMVKDILSNSSHVSHDSYDIYDIYDNGSRKRQLSPQIDYNVIKKKQMSEAYYKALKAINEYSQLSNSCLYK